MKIKNKVSCPDCNGSGSVDINKFLDDNKKYFEGRLSQKAVDTYSGCYLGEWVACWRNDTTETNWKINDCNAWYIDELPIEEIRKYVLIDNDYLK